MFFFSWKYVSQLRYWKRSKFPLIVAQKHADHLNEGLLWKSVVPLFRRTYALSVRFKNETSKKKLFPVLRQKPTQILPWNLLNGATIHFYCMFDHMVWWIYFSNICILNTCKELNWLGKHMKKIRSGQAIIFVLNWVKHSFSLWFSLILKSLSGFNKSTYKCAQTVSLL